jgi:hypothetical protein
MSTAGGTLFVLSIAAIATAFLIKKNECCVVQSVSEANQNEIDELYMFDQSGNQSQDIYAMFYS